MESSQYQPPVRRSLTDEELAARVQLATTSHSGVEALMDLLVAQEALRAQEDAELEAWVERMEADGSPAAIAALSKFQGKDFIPQTDQVVIVPEPVEEELEETVVVEAEVETQPEPIVEDPYAWLNQAPQVEEPEVTITEPEVEAPEVEEPQEPFSWFTQEDTEEDVGVEEVVTVIEEVEPETVHPEGTESVDEFERLIESSAAEEELTALEVADPETTPSNILVPSNEHRNRKPLSQLFVWLGASATVVPLLLTWTLIGFGLSAVAIVTDLVVGYLVAGLLIATASLAGKRSGLATSVISRAVFGFWGNTVPMVFVTIARWVLSAITIAVFLFLMTGIDQRIPSFDTSLWSFAGINFTAGFAVGFGLIAGATVISLVRGTASRIIQMILSLGAFALVLESFVGFSSMKLAFAAPGTVGIITKESLAGISLIVLVTSAMWIAVAPNLAKSIPMKPRGIKVFASVLVANFFVPAVIGSLALLWLGPAAAGGAVSIPEAVMAMPQWARGALVSGIAISLVYILTLNLKTAALDFMSLTSLRNRTLGIVASSVVVLGLLFVFSMQPTNQTVAYLANLFVLVAVLVAGWLGMLVADVALRRIAYHELSLTRSYGYYGKFNVTSFLVWIATVAAGVLVVPIKLLGFGFTGMFAASLGLDETVGSQAIGFVGVLVLGMLLTVAARIPQIRKQEREVVAVESRREALNDIFVGQE